MRTVEEILAGAAEVNGLDSRCERQSRLNALKARLDEYLNFFHGRSKNGPSLREMVRIVADIEEMLEYIKKYDQE